MQKTLGSLITDIFNTKLREALFMELVAFENLYSSACIDQAMASFSNHSYWKQLGLRGPK